ncbi:hypothetical protein GCM10011583_55950 [Streptomyces camponoticapitis]|uniref:Uncharacterized protein n=1 Tax=Streptomyces camponoticapitis TaxID=1616125 RepID=A0ABQ2EMJ9_9ACTN|nr:hypothetical protein GCM10011583_55950 [Streptomyces camponoticapitis]
MRPNVCRAGPEELLSSTGLDRLVFTGKAPQASRGEAVRVEGVEKAPALGVRNGARIPGQATAAEGWS